MNAAIETRNLCVWYGARRGIERFDLTVEQGEVFGFLGPNGAGKTTMIRVLLDVIRPTRGLATIFGMDCHNEGVAVRRRVGYLPGDLSLDPSLTASRYLDLLAALHGGRVESGYRRELCRRLDLDPNRRMGEYSKGNRQKIGVVAALMARSDLLILDEPTTGLDPLMQRVVLELVAEARRDGRTVFFSSHILPEVQQVCDRVGVVRQGHLIDVERVETLMRRASRRIRLRLATLPPAGGLALDGVTEIHRDGHLVTLEVRGELGPVLAKAQSWGIEDLDMPPISLEEVFLNDDSPDGAADGA